MKIVVALSLVCLSVFLIPAHTVSQDEGDVRGAFLTSRPKEKASNTNSASKPPSRRAPKRTGSSSTGTRKSSLTDSSDQTGTTTTKSTTKSVTRVNSQRIGLGLTLFMRDSNGLAVRTDPSHIFQKGDRVRVLLETNADGYLYIFNTTNNGPPVMIYPDAQLDEAGNYLQAHIPFEIPSSLGTEERLRWLAFDENAGDERLFFVFSREPLAQVPIEDELVKFCGTTTNGCAFHPKNDVWEAIKKQMNEPLEVDKTASFGRAQTSSEKQAATRGIGLSREDPEPSMIMMASSTKSTLVTALDLIHK